MRTSGLRWMLGLVLATVSAARGDEATDLPSLRPPQRDDAVLRAQAAAAALPPPPPAAPPARRPVRPPAVNPPNPPAASTPTRVPVPPTPIGPAAPVGPTSSEEAPPAGAPARSPAPFAAEMAASPFAPVQPGPTAAGDMFSAAASGTNLTGLAGPSVGGIPQMIGDQGPGIQFKQVTAFPPPPTVTPPFPPPTPPTPPSPRKVSALVPSVRGLKISENQSPRPQDRVFFTFDYFTNVNGHLNQRFQTPVTNLRVYREIFGLEKTFDDGNGSIGLRLPLDTLTADNRVKARFAQLGGTHTSLNDLNVFLKYIFKQDVKTGSVVTGGFAITPPTGPSAFAGAKVLSNAIHTTLMQPFVGYILTDGKRAYLQGFSAFEFPANPAQVTEMYNDLGVGYFLYRATEPDYLFTGIAPTFETHVNTPLNHRHAFDPNDPSGTPTVVNLTFGVNFEIYGRSLLTVGYATPVTGPRPFDSELLVLYNFRFGGRARRALPPIISG